MVLMKRMLDRLAFEEVLKQSSLPTQGSNRGFDPVQLFINFIVGVWCGANRIEHLEVTRQDEVIRQVFQWKRMPGHRAFKRFFNKFTQSKNQEVFTYLYQWYFSNLQFNNFTLDFDSSVFTRYGEQQGAKRGYNPRNRGRKSHHPLIAFVADTRMVANFWLRAGDSGAASNFKGFLEDTLTKLQGKSVGLLRADAENRIKELKYDFGAENFSCKDFWATEAILNTIMMAYNLMSLFRQTVVGTKAQIRYKVFAIGVYVVKDGNSRILKLFLAMKRSEWFKGLWVSS